MIYRFNYSSAPQKTQGPVSVTQTCPWFFVPWFSGHLDADHPVGLGVSWLPFERKCPPCNGRFCSISSFKHRDLRTNLWLAPFVWIRELKCSDTLSRDALSDLGNLGSLEVWKLEKVQFAQCDCSLSNTFVDTIFVPSKVERFPKFKKLKVSFT